MKKVTPSELISVAVALAGPAATDDEIAAVFTRAVFLMDRAESWLLDEKRQAADAEAYCRRAAESADSVDPVLPWESPILHEISGYDKAHPGKDAVARGKLLFDAFRKGLERTHGSKAVETLRQKYRKGIEASRLRQVWPTVSKWRKAKSDKSV